MQVPSFISAMSPCLSRKFKSTEKSRILLVYSMSLSDEFGEDSARETEDTRFIIISVARFSSSSRSVRLQRALLNIGSLNCSVKSNGSAGLVLKWFKRSSRLPGF